MNRRQKIVQQRFLGNEEAVIKRLDQVYGKSLDDLTKRVAELDSSIDTLRKAYDSVTDDEIGELAAAFLKKNQHLTPKEARETLQSMIQSKVYQKDYQNALKKQVGDILDTMHKEEFKTVSEYLDKCYEEGFIGTMYDLQGQGIPMCFPLDQEAMVTAVQLDSKISHGLYTRLGEDVALLKKKITAQVSRGVATAMTYQQIAQQLAGVSNIGYNNAVRIARTEGHRIQCQSGMDACYKAKEKGADVVKQWDSTLDGRTRESHAAVDGEYRELDEKFSNGLEFPGDPHGKAAEVINCRCALLQRARWAIGGGFTKMNNFTKELETFDSPEAYDEFKKAFFSKENKRYMDYVGQMEEKYGTKNFEKVLGSMNNREYKRYKELLDGNPMFHKQAAKPEPPKKAKTTFDSFKLSGIDPEYAADIEETFNGLMDDYPISGLSVKTNRAKGEFGHYNGQIIGKTVNGHKNYAQWNSEICISKAEMQNRKQSAAHHIANYEDRMSKLATAERCDLATIPHEYAHAVDAAYTLERTPAMKAYLDKFKTAQQITMQDVQSINDFNNAMWKSDNRLSKEIFDELQAEYGLTYTGTIQRIAVEYGTYASSSIAEFLAEGFANMRILPDSEKTDFMRSFEKIFDRKYKEVLGDK